MLKASSVVNCDEERDDMIYSTCVQDMEHHYLAMFACFFATSGLNIVVSLRFVGWPQICLEWPPSETFNGPTRGKGFLILIIIIFDISQLFQSMSQRFDSYPHSLSL